MFTKAKVIVMQAKIRLMGSIVNYLNYFQGFKQGIVGLAWVQLHKRFSN
eukprot:UN22131